jgi:hypothetical protein
MTVLPRRHIIQSARSRGLMFEPAAVAFLERFLMKHESTKSTESFLNDLLETLTNNQRSSFHPAGSNELLRDSRPAPKKLIVTVAILRQAISLLEQRVEIEMKNETQLNETKSSRPVSAPSAQRPALSGLKMVSAFHTPRLVFDATRKNFTIEERSLVKDNNASWSLLGSADSKVQSRSCECYNEADLFVAYLIFCFLVSSQH